MDKICDKNKCTGCSACLNICPVQAISMEADSLGFLHPHIDQILCINCSLCYNICPVNKPVTLHYPQKAMAAYSSDPIDRASSTSGGAASVFSQFIINEGGIVYGCSGENAMHIHHTRVSNIEDLHKLKGSKYVQSELSYIFSDVKNDLIANRKVLFIGSPCQISGLKNFLQKEYQNLITVDLVCHGVPSQKLLNDSIEENLANKTIDNIISIKFRKKGNKKSQQKYGFYLTSTDGNNLLSENFPKNNYISGFMFGLFCRESCYNCSYVSPNRCSDITIGDFWGFKGTENSLINEYEGLSLILPITNKGMLFIDAVKKGLNWVECPLSEAISGNGRFQIPLRKNANHDLFKSLYATHGFNKSCEICLADDRKKFKRENLKKNFRSFFSKIPLAKKLYNNIKIK